MPIKANDLINTALTGMIIGMALNAGKKRINDLNTMTTPDIVTGNIDHKSNALIISILGMMIYTGYNMVPQIN